MKRQSTGLLYALLFLLLFLTLASQVPFTIDAVRKLGRGTLAFSATKNQGMLFPILCFLVLPWLSIPLGFWVAAVRPRDFRAWLVLGILLGMSQLVRTSSISPGASPAAIAASALIFRDLAERAWPACMMLFGLYFPHRGRIDERLPWIKWVLLAPMAYTSLHKVLRDSLSLLGVDAGHALPAPPPAWLDAIPVFLAISLFFVGISAKYSDPKLPPDDRRRLKILYSGCTAAMTPAFLLWLYAIIFLHRQDLPDSPLVGFSLAAFVLFPLTMAYVIVVERAMDVRMVIRQGLQYALAQRGVRIIQIAVTSAVLFAAFAAAGSASVNRPLRITLISLGVVSIFLIRRAAGRIRIWVDRRFFREAYDADQILGELSEQVRSILDRQSLLETVCRRISESLHVERIVVLLREDGLLHPALATGYPAHLDVAIPGDAEPGPEVLTKLDSQLLLPLPSRKELLGYISLGPKKSEEPYSPNDARLLRTVAAQTGLALENSRLSEAIASEIAQRETLHREIEIAREVQQRLFPQRLPEVPALQYAGHCRPARGVGGDYYDFLALASGRLGLAIADISGKGIPAALLMASLQASVRGQSQAGGNVAELMTQVNRLVYDASPENRYATFFYAQFDPATRRLLYTNGGHNAPILLRGSDVLRLETGGPVVGLFRDSQYEQEEIQLLPGDLLVLYTDGISEAEDPREEEWGEAALIETAAGCRELPPNEMISRIMRAADTFAAGAPQHDDMTLVIAKVCG